MKCLFFISGIVLCAVATKAQSANVDTNYTTRISSTQWMPEGNAILLGVVKHHKTDQKAPFFSKVFLYNIQSRQLTYLFDDGSNLVVSPDGKTIAFLKRSEKAKGTIYFFSMDTKKETVFASDTLSKYGLAWSGDGKKIAYNITKKGLNATPGVDIFTIDLETKEVKQITNSGTHKSYNPQWSPDSRHIVYYFEKDDGRDQVWLTDANGSFHRNLTNDTTTHNYFPAWIDANTIVYTAGPDEQLMMMHADGSNRQKINGVKSTPVKYNSKAHLLAYIKSENENRLMLFDWNKKTAREILDGTKLMDLF